MSLNSIFNLYETKIFKTCLNIDSLLQVIITKTLPKINNIDSKLVLLLETLFRNNMTNNKTNNSNSVQFHQNLIYLVDFACSLPTVYFSADFLSDIITRLRQDFKYDNENIANIESLITIANKYNLPTDLFKEYNFNFTTLLTKYVLNYNNSKSEIKNRNIIICCDIICQNEHTSIDDIEILIDFIYVIQTNKKDNKNKLNNNEMDTEDDNEANVDLTYDSFKQNSNFFILSLINNLILFVNNLELKENKSKDKLINLINKLKLFISNYIDEIFTIQSNDLIINYLHTLNISFHIITSLVNLLNTNDERKIIISILEEILKKFSNKSFNTSNNLNNNDLIKLDDNFNPDNLTNKLKEDIFLIFIKTITTFIELIITKSVNESNPSLLLEYVFYFVKFSTTYLKDSIFLLDLLKSMTQILNRSDMSPDAISGFLVHLFYFSCKTIKEEVLEIALYEDPKIKFILSFIEKESLVTSLNIMNIIFQNLVEENESDKTNKKSLIFSLISDNFNSRIITINLLVKLLSIIEAKIITLFLVKDSNNDANTISEEKSLVTSYLIKISSSLYLNKNQIMTAIKSEDSTKMHKIYFAELEIFENLFFEMHTCANNLIINFIPELFSESFEKKIRVYLLEKYFDSIIVESSNSFKDLDNVSIILLINLVAGKMDEITIQISLAILTKIIKNIDPQNIKKHFKNLITIIKKCNSVIQASCFVFLTKVFETYNIQFIEKFNEFFELFVENIDISKDTTEHMVNCLFVLSSCYSEYFAPFITKILSKLISIVNNPLFANLKPLINKICVDIARKSMFTSSFKSVKEIFDLIQEQALNNESYNLLFNYFNESFKTIDELMMHEFYLKISKFFVFALSSENKHLTGETLKTGILTAFSSFVLKLKEKQLREIFTNLVQFTFVNDIESTIRYDLKKCTNFFLICNTILETISYIFVKYFKEYQTNMIDIMNSIISLYNFESRDGKKKKSREFFDSKMDPNSEDSYLALNTLILKNITLVYKNNNSQLLNDNFQEMFEPLANQVIDFNKHIKFINLLVKTNQFGRRKSQHLL